MSFPTGPTTRSNARSSASGDSSSPSLRAASTKRSYSAGSSCGFGGDWSLCDGIVDSFSHAGTATFGLRLNGMSTRKPAAVAAIVASRRGTTARFGNATSKRAAVSGHLRQPPAIPAKRHISNLSASPGCGPRSAVSWASISAASSERVGGSSARRAAAHSDTLPITTRSESASLTWMSNLLRATGAPGSSRNSASDRS